MSDLLKTTLIKRHRSSENIAEEGEKAVEKSLRAIQIVEVSRWVEGLAENELSKSSIWFNSGSSNVSFVMMSTLARKLVDSLKLPCSGLVHQMMRFLKKGTLPVLSHQLNGEVVPVMLATLFWIICTSTPEQLLVFLFGLYDLRDDNNMDMETVFHLLMDIFVDDGNDGERAYKHCIEEVKIRELVDELFEYSNVTTSIRRNSIVSLDSDDSTYSDFNDFSPFYISRDAFVKFFTQKRSGHLWRLNVFQRKVKKITIYSYHIFSIKLYYLNIHCFHYLIIIQTYLECRFKKLPLE